MIDPNSREEIAKREIGDTAAAPATVRALVIVFLAAIATIPLLEWSAAANALATRATSPASADGAVWGRIVAANRAVLAWLNAFERALEDRSRIGRTLRPPAQRIMTGWLGAGNERVYPGRGGWLFYRSDVEYVTGPPFLEPSRLRRRVAGATEWDVPPQPDPRKAIDAFHRQLASRGITLVVMPTPVKASIHPEMLTDRYAAAERPLQNASHADFLEQLAARGVLVFDPSSALFAARRADVQYLARDTHWRPEAMELAADRLAALIEEHVALPPVAAPAYRVERIEVHNAGDTTRMLDLAEDQTLYPPEPVWLRRVLLPDGSLWRSSRRADVLVLGDSFSNIYSLESMGWGTSAGFVEQLSLALRRPVDRLVQNDQGAYATREMLQREPGRLDGKRVVVWQFSARELAVGDWKMIPFDN